MSFAASKGNVVVWRDGVPLVVLDWQFALELGRAYQDVGEKGTRGKCIEKRVSYQDERRRVRGHVTDTDELRVLVESRGVVIGDFQPAIILELGNAMIGKARLAEEHAKAARVIADQALMMRLGGGVSLSGNPDINAEAWKEAENDPELRKNIPTPRSIKSKEKFGYPIVRKDGPRSAEEKVAELSDAERKAMRRLLN